MLNSSVSVIKGNFLAAIHHYIQSIQTNVTMEKLQTTLDCVFSCPADLMNMWQIVSGGHKNLHGRVKGLMILKLQEKRACSVSHPSSLAPAPSPNGPATSPSSQDLHAKHSLPPSHSWFAPFLTL